MPEQVFEASEIANGDAIDQMERIRSAVGALGALEGLGTPNTDSEPTQGFQPTDRMARIVSALRVVGDNFTQLQEDMSNEPHTNGKVVLSEEQKGMVTTSTGLIEFVARNIGAQLPRHVDIDDLISEGFLGLVDAATRYDETQGEFGTFAVHRIRGAILDYLRQQDFAPRSVRLQHRRITDAELRLAAKNGHPPTDREIAVELELPTERVAGYRKDAFLGNTISLELEAGTSDRSTTTLADIIADTNAINPELQVESRELMAMLVEAIGKLPENQRIVIEAYYFDEKTLGEIGELLGVTESRACQLHGVAVKSLGLTLGPKFID